MGGFSVHVVPPDVPHVLLLGYLWYMWCRPMCHMCCFGGIFGTCGSSSCATCPAAGVPPAHVVPPAVPHVPLTGRFPHMWCRLMCHMFRCRGASRTCVPPDVPHVLLLGYLRYMWCRPMCHMYRRWGYLRYMWFLRMCHMSRCRGASRTCGAA
ncbi:MAG: hypothetical protein IJ840_00840 [Bacteroidales bacterium]|nr:hypothetical protein [Bacteroidales bacterium]